MCEILVKELFEKLVQYVLVFEASNVKDALGAAVSIL